LKVFDDQGRVCLPSGAEIRLDTEMNLYGAVLEPAAAAFREIGRFRNLGYAEKPLIEGASLILPAGWHGELYVIDGADEHGRKSDDGGEQRSSRSRQKPTVKVVLARGSAGSRRFVEGRVGQRP
jgi:hypothetical protein